MAEYNRASRPVYRVPTMREINDLPWNGYRVVSTLAGFGGTGLGYRMAGYRVCWANEIDESAYLTYGLNTPDTLLNPYDIRELEASRIKKALSNDIDVFDSFLPVISGNSWDKIGLSWEVIRLIKDLQPRTFILNISARAITRHVRGVAKLILDIVDDVKKAGYSAEIKLLEANNLGLPVPWQRLILIGVRSDLARRYGVKPAFAAPLAYQYTMRDALADYSKDRTPTIAEQKRFYSYPEDYSLSLLGDSAEQFKRLARAFPPVFMFHIAKTVQTEILDKCK